MTTSRKKMAISSALWAAYGDALGFPTELVNQERLEQRIGNDTITEAVEWSRIIGGRFGAQVRLPAGAYSDDTQLRLCTSRSIRGDGHFDVEAFSKIELPVWLCYALGAGRGSKVGATALGLRNTAWFGNFFDQRDTTYINGGGNGAAMRVQPHVWAAKDFTKADTYLGDVIRNAICTHGHPRGIGGAVIHAACLAYTMRGQALPHPDEWHSLGDFLDISLDLISSDIDLSTFWVPTWEQRTSKSLANEMMFVKDEWIADVEECKEYLSQRPEMAYELTVSKLGGLRADQRGSGLKSALFALVLAWIYRESEPSIALKTSANFLSSDTDTISSMAGALMGALSPDIHPPIPVQDADYIEAEARRLTIIGEGDLAQSFVYPDLLSWQAPKSQLDAVGKIDNELGLAGIGLITPVSEVFSSGKNDVVWQWYVTEFGQKVLCKRRTEVLKLAKNSLPAIASKLEEYVRPSHLIETSKNFKSRRATPTQDMFQNEALQQANRPDSKPAPIESNLHYSLDKMSDDAIRSGFDVRLIGKHILALSERDMGIELAMAYSAIIAKAKRARARRERS